MQPCASHNWLWLQLTLCLWNKCISEAFKLPALLWGGHEDGYTCVRAIRASVFEIRIVYLVLEPRCSKVSYMFPQITVCFEYF